MPVLVSSLASSVLFVGVGGFHSCAMLQSAVPGVGASTVCWGKNDFGQLGDNSSTQVRQTPEPIFGISAGVACLATGHQHSCAGTTSGSLYCWGANSKGQLGLGYLSTKEVVPVLVTGIVSRVTGITAGGEHTCALLESDAVMCWGRCQESQMGDNSPPCASGVYTHYVPVTVFGLGPGSGTRTISAGDLHTCAVLKNGSAVCWGGASALQQISIFVVEFNLLFLQTTILGNWVTVLTSPLLPFQPSSDAFLVLFKMSTMQ